MGRTRCGHLDAVVVVRVACQAQVCGCRCMWRGACTRTPARWCTHHHYHCTTLAAHRGCTAHSVAACAGTPTPGGGWLPTAGVRNGFDSSTTHCVPSSKQEWSVHQRVTIPMLLTHAPGGDGCGAGGVVEGCVPCGCYNKVVTPRRVECVPRASPRCALPSTSSTTSRRVNPAGWEYR